MAMNLNAVLAITASVTGAQAVDQLQSRMSRLHGAAETAARRFSALGMGVRNFIAIASASSFVAFGKSVIDTADNLNDLSQRTGVAVETLSQFSTVAQKSGTDIGAVATGLKKLSGNITEAASGNADLSRLFQALQIDVRNADGTIRDAGQVMLDLSSRFRDMEDGAVKSALAVKLLGKSGDQMIPMLNEGAQAISDMTTVIDSQFAQAADRFNDRLVDMGNLMKSAFVAMGPTFFKFFDDLVGAFKNLDTSGTAATLLLKGFQDALTMVVATAVTAVGVFNTLSASLGGLAQAASQVSAGNFDGALTTLGDTTMRVSEQFGATKDRVTELLNQLNLVKAFSQQPINIEVSKPLQKSHGFDMALTNSDRAAAVDDIARALGNNGGGANGAARTLNNTLNQTNVIVDGLWKRSQTFAEGWKSGLSQVGAMANDVGGAIEDAMTGAFRNAEDAFVSFVQTGKVDFSSLINSMIADLARAQFRQLTSSLFGGFNFGNIFGSLFGGGTASVPLPPIRPYAMGTDYAQGGLSLVGENGPELVRLPRGASVTPSHKLGGMGGTTINQNFTFTGGVTEKDLARILPEVSKAGANMALSQIAGGRLSARMA
jgi:hypothetical protein